MNCKVAIVILNYKSWEDTLEEIGVCNRILGVDNKDIIVIDNCSPNESADKLLRQSEIDEFVFIMAKENVGYGAGNNIGLEYALENGYTHALILNNDIIVENTDLIQELSRVFDAEDNVAVVNPDIYSPSGHLFNRDSVRPSFFDYTLGLIKYKKKGRQVNDVNGYGFVYRPQGCCMLVDLKKMQEVGFFDEKTFLYCEEPILAEKLLKRGYLCACDTSVSVVHNHSKTVKSIYDTKRIIRINNKSFSYYLKEYRGFHNFQIILCCLFNSLKLRLLDK